jgi:hypothetical protein
MAAPTPKTAAAALAHMPLEAWVALQARLLEQEREAELAEAVGKLATGEADDLGRRALFCRA